VIQHYSGHFAVRLLQNAPCGNGRDTQPSADRYSDRAADISRRLAQYYNLHQLIRDALRRSRWTVHLNTCSAQDIANLGTRLVDAKLNWWKCAGGPGVDGCSTITGAGVQSAPGCRSLLI
jgi:hypothetical protein